MSHALKRTSPKGGPFIGYCMKCGQENIPLSRMHEECPDVLGESQDETLLRAIRG